MKMYAVAASIVVGALFSVSAQALPAAPASVKAQIQSGDAVQKVHHCRRWSGGWGCRYHRW